MERRELLTLGAGFALAHITASTTACANTQGEGTNEPTGDGTDGPAAHEGHEGHEGHGASAEGSAVATATSGCVAAGKACLQHCLRMLQSGDTSMKECSQAVAEMIPVCEAMVTLANADSKHLPALAAVCKAVCTDCKAACDKHAAMHAECKACAEACGATLGAIASLA